MCILIYFADYAEVVGYAIAPRDFPAQGDRVLVHRRDGTPLGIGEVIRRDPVEPYAAVRVMGFTSVVHFDDLSPAPVVVQ